MHPYGSYLRDLPDVFGFSQYVYMEGLVSPAPSSLRLGSPGEINCGGLREGR